MLFTLSTGLAVGQESKPSPFRIIPDLRLWGAMVDLGYQGLQPFEGLTTGIWLRLSGAYQTSHYYKNPDGTPVGAADYFASNPAVTYTDFSQLNLQWNLGIRQEIIGDLLETGIYYRGWYNNNYPEDQAITLIANSGLPEASGSLTHSFSVLLKADAVEEKPVTRVKSGLSAELTGEIAPAGLNSSYGQADFSRATLEIKTFLPIYQSVVEKRPDFNLFSLYAGFYSITDYIGGESIPYYAAASFGGISYRDGLGGTVRGYESGRYTGQFKTAFSSELRANLPTIFLPGLIPVALIHIDGGYDSENQELLSSIGAGVGIDLFGFGTILVYTHYALQDRTLDGNQLSLFELGFGLHF
jgi:hypothetical protein